MTNADTIKQERMHIRLDTLSKQKLERAAAYVHKNLSEFVLGQALHAADEVIHEHESLTLNQADWNKFLLTRHPSIICQKPFFSHSSITICYQGLI
jgi:uncharacterized protein (DUF1778 family)